VTCRETYRELSRRLRLAGRPEAVERSVLFELAAGLRYSECDPDAQMPDSGLGLLWNLVARREAGEPLQYLARRWPFLDFELTVGEGVLIPRPETETVVGAAAEFLGGRKDARVLDLCAGSGCIAIALARAFPSAAVTAVEKEEAAYKYLETNIRDLSPGVRAVLSDVRELPDDLLSARWDCIVCNPPYLTDSELEDAGEELGFEPPGAFRGGEDGLDFYRLLVPLAAGMLTPGGAVFFETGSAQTEAVRGLFRPFPELPADVLYDQYGLPRVVRGRKTPFVVQQVGQ